MGAARPAWWSALGPTLLGIGVLVLLQAGASMARREGATTLLGALAHSAAYYPPWVLFGVVTFGTFARADTRLRAPRFAVSAFVVATLLFYLPYLVYEVAVAEVQAGRPWTGAPAALAAYPPFAFFADFVLFVGAFGLLYGAALARAELARERAAARTEAELLTLRLQLEQQRLRSLQAQLEPHFLFNALNAVAGLVRVGADDEALAAISKLAALLRYATGASRAEWVGLDEEIAFVEDYLALQRLRYGDRLHASVHTAGDASTIRCPPLLLQPLVENAIRHDLDTHAGDGHLRVEVAVDAAGAVVRVDNPAHAGRTPNPGLGLGLASVAERLALCFPGAAPLAAGLQGERFVVRLTIPRTEDE